MNFQFYLEKLENSEEFKNFMEKYPDAYLCSGFFIIEKQAGKNQQHLDYFIPSEKKLFSFQLEEGVRLMPLEFFGDVPEKLSECNFNLPDIEALIFEEMEKQGVDKKIQKMLFSLQAKQGKCFILATIFISNFGLLKITIDLKEKQIVEFEKKSFLDMLKVFGKKK